MTNIGRIAWLSIYKDLQRIAHSFPQYSYRHFAQRRIREYFESNREASDFTLLRKLYTEAQEAKIYNLMEDDFPSVKEYNDYLEHVEEIIAQLVEGSDTVAVEKEMRKFAEEHESEIERNRRRLNADDQWIKKILEDEAKQAARQRADLGNEYFNMADEVGGKPQSIISQLRDSDLPAQIILDRERKVQIEAELAEKDERERKKRERSGRHKPVETTSFGPIRVTGKAYVHIVPVLPPNCAPIPRMADLSHLGYLAHVRARSTGSLAAGFQPELSCFRALSELRWCLYDV